MVRRCSLVVVLCLALVACSEPGGEAEKADPGAPAPTLEEYATASEEACDVYLGALLAMAQQDDELDPEQADASADFFMRRADDIAARYDQYRSTIDSLPVPDDDDMRAAHDEIVALMGDNLEAIEEVADAHEQGADEQAAAAMVQSARIEEEIAAVQSAHDLPVCG